MKKLNLIALVALLVFGLGFQSFGQVILMGDVGHPQSSPADCNTFGIVGTNFQDDGGVANYSPNYNDTIVFCPDLTTGTKMTVTFAINAGYTWDVHGSDSVYVYDGPDTSWPLLGVHNSDTDPTGFNHVASWGNPSGCLTIVFISDGSMEGTGWQANAACGNQAQPFYPHIEAYINGTGPDALSPADTGYVDVCFGDSILFVATPQFPYSYETTGYGYSQSLSTVNYDWNISSGGTFPDNDSIWFTPPGHSGYLVDLAIEDIFPQIEHMMCKVRVSQVPSFATTGPIEDTICLGNTTTLIGGVTATDTAGVEIPPGTFQMGGSYAGLTYLPDGTGVQYAAPINISGFPPGSTISSPSDLNQVCITMEHSYIGDLEIALECPTGTQVTLLNSYSPGFIPGGTSGGGIYLGDPIDDAGGGGPGEGWEYCFSSAFATWGTYPTELGLGNTVPAPIFGMGNPSMNPGGIYLPETSFAAFAGCPVNGTWTIIVQDNLGIDDGYIFEWGLFFDASYFPGVNSYQNYVIDDYWMPDPSIISGTADTAIVVQPPTTGDYPYTFVVEDDFGCVYDTTVYVHVVELPTIFNDTVVCDLFFNTFGLINSIDGGVWSSTATEVVFNPDVTTEQPIITATTPGTYTVTFTDNYCNHSVDAVIDFPPNPTFNIMGDMEYCASNGGAYIVVQDSLSIEEITWGLSDPVADASFTNTLPAGTYNLHASDDQDLCTNDTTIVITEIPEPTIDLDEYGCYLVTFINGTTSSAGGVWTASDTAVHFVPNNTVDNPEVNVSTPGVYTLTYTDNACNVSLSQDVDFPPYPWTDLLDTSICAGSTHQVVALNLNNYPTEYTWDHGPTGPIIQVSEAGTYYVTVSNICHSAVDSVVIDVILCDIHVPNVMSLADGSPNGLWFVEANGLSEFNVIITNRWGNIVYECNDPNAQCFWDGRDRGGKFVNAGTYFYIIDAKAQGGDELNKQGFIQVVE